MPSAIWSAWLRRLTAASLVQLCAGAATKLYFNKIYRINTFIAYIKRELPKQPFNTENGSSAPVIVKKIFEIILKAKGRRRRIVVDPTGYAAIYAIGDVHGCIDQLENAYDRILKDEPEKPGTKLVVFLGDYVDRGPNSRAVLDLLSSPPPSGVEQICLCGNHDNEFLRFIKNPRENFAWLKFGGKETLKSYGIDCEHLLKKAGGWATIVRLANEAIPKAHHRFLASLPSMLVSGKLIFVHAGIRPGVPLSKQSDHDIMWIREPFLTEGPDAALLVVHGHTPKPEADFGRNRVGIDTAAFATGRLTVARFAQGEIAILR